MKRSGEDRAIESLSLSETLQYSRERPQKRHLLVLRVREGGGGVSFADGSCHSAETRTQVNTVLVGQGIF